MGIATMKGPFDKGEMNLYFGAVAQLLMTGRAPATLDTYGGSSPTQLEGWSDEQLTLMLDEGRRQLDSFNGRFDSLRTRAQWLFTTILALLVFVGGQLDTLIGRHVLLQLGWYLGAVLLVVALLGAASVFLGTAQLGSVDTVLLSAEDPSQNMLEVLARSYPKAVVVSANTFRSRFTILRDALLFCVLGILVEIVTWSLLVTAS